MWQRKKSVKEKRKKTKWTNSISGHSEPQTGRQSTKKGSLGPTLFQSLFDEQQAPFPFCVNMHLTLPWNVSHPRL